MAVITRGITFPDSADRSQDTARSPRRQRPARTAHDKTAGVVSSNMPETSLKANHIQKAEGLLSQQGALKQAPVTGRPKKELPGKLIIELSRQGFSVRRIARYLELHGMGEFCYRTIARRLRRQRIKTGDQLYKEGSAIKVIEATKARERQGDRTDIPNIVENLPPSSYGKTRDIVADKIGLGSGKQIKQNTGD